MIKYRNIYRTLNECVLIDCFSAKGTITGTIIIDKDDIDKVNIYQWHIEHSRKNIYYAQASYKGKTIRLHKLILPSLKQIDHINHNGLDNRKSNLREATNAENNRNKNFSRSPLSGYTGIRYNSKAKSYYVRIMVNKKEISLGVYKNIEDAIAARKAGELKYFKEFRYSNGKEEVKC